MDPTSSPRHGRALWTVFACAQALLLIAALVTPVVAVSAQPTGCLLYTSDAADE